METDRHNLSKSKIHLCCSIKEHPNSPWIWMPDSSSTFPKALDRSKTEKVAVYSCSSNEKENSTASDIWIKPSMPNCRCLVSLAVRWKNWLLVDQAHWYYSLYQAKSTGSCPVLLQWEGVSLLSIGKWFLILCFSFVFFSSGQDWS